MLTRVSIYQSLASGINRLHSAAFIKKWSANSGDAQSERRGEKAAQLDVLALAWEARAIWSSEIAKPAFRAEAGFALVGLLRSAQVRQPGGLPHKQRAPITSDAQNFARKPAP
ncbi:hypothetical protein [Paraburkholderia sp. RAU2J]|uniref:hypothetical protein n=1 Tax=Paraburkholderia sp. RAU2J TaxID=1938810 RepID=UPI0011C4A4A0|nr:hypothetical protein [Paraburkholderia sp. RAU2J]